MEDMVNKSIRNTSSSSEDEAQDTVTKEGGGQGPPLLRAVQLSRVQSRIRTRRTGGAGLHWQNSQETKPEQESKRRTRHSSC